MEEIYMPKRLIDSVEEYAQKAHEGKFIGDWNYYFTLLGELFIEAYSEDREVNDYIEKELATSLGG
jgi:hypothetical protein